MKTLIRGEKVKLSDFTPAVVVEVELAIDAPFDVDFTCFGLNAERQLTDDRYMVFYNQLSSPNQEVRLHQQATKSQFNIDLAKMPATLPYLVFTATIDGAQTMNQIRSGSFLVKANGQPILTYSFGPNDFQQQKAIIIGEIYYKSLWRVASIGQGFDGGLAALLKSFGGEVAEEATPVAQVAQGAAVASGSRVTPGAQSATAVPGSPRAPLTPGAAVAATTSSSAPATNNKKVLLEKKMQQEAPHILDLSKKALISLEKVGLQEHVAKVALCLDISGSMSDLYKSGKIQQFVERILALATRFDDDGSIDVFLFGGKAHDAGELTISNSRSFINGLLKKYRLEGSTYYSKAITMIRKHYLGSSSHRKNPLPQDVPIYVMFVTDGDTFDEKQTTKQIVNASYEPIFWQFMGIAEERKGPLRGLFGLSNQSSEFPYLEKLDTLQERYIDNAGFFSVTDPAGIPDNELYDLLMKEYPQWMKEAKAKGLLMK